MEEEFISHHHPYEPIFVINRTTKIASIEERNYDAVYIKNRSITKKICEQIEDQTHANCILIIGSDIAEADALLKLKSAYEIWIEGDFKHNIKLSAGIKLYLFNCNSFDRLKFIDPHRSVVCIFHSKWTPELNRFHFITLEKQAAKVEINETITSSIVLKNSPLTTDVSITVKEYEQLRQIVINNCESLENVQTNGFVHRFTVTNCKKLQTLKVSPDSVQYINCSNNNLETLSLFKENLESKLIKSLDCSNNNLQNLPDLIEYVSELNCSHNNLQTLPEIPFIYNLDCSHNNLQTLPKMSTMVNELICSHNRLQDLPRMPYLVELDCSHNNLQNLPRTFPRLVNFDCSNNPALNSLPLMPKIEYLDYSDTNITNIDLSKYPLIERIMPLTIKKIGKHNLQFEKYCTSKLDHFSQEEFENNYVISVIVANSEKSNSSIAHCFKTQDLLRFWWEKLSTSGEYSEDGNQNYLLQKRIILSENIFSPILSEPVFKLPYPGVWLDNNAFKMMHNYTAFVLVKKGVYDIGNYFGTKINDTIYTLKPINKKSIDIDNLSAIKVPDNFVPADGDSIKVEGIKNVSRSNSFSSEGTSSSNSISSDMLSDIEE